MIWWFLKVLDALPVNCVVRNPLYMFKIPKDEAE